MTGELFAFRRNVVLVASAGTGKTHALVGVLLHLLLGASALGDGQCFDPARVGATTFSRKAAAEIRQRLQTELEHLARGAPSAHAAALAAALGQDALVARARKSLVGLDQAVIGTLHGFAYAIARAHGLSLGLPPGFGVASEDDTESWAADAIERALSERAKAEPDVVRDFLRLMRGMDRAQTELRRSLLALEEDGRAATELGLPEDDERSLDEKIARLHAFAEQLGSDTRGGEPAAAFLAAYASADVAGLTRAAGDLFATHKPRGDDKWLPLRDELRGGTMRERGENLVRAWASRRRILPSAALVRSVLSRAQTLLAEAQAEAGAVGFGAVLRLARDALRDDPSVAAETASAYDALLVDEFQDTSRVQVELLRLLWERNPSARAPGKLPAWGDLRDRGLLVVGDRKQSIYAFRGADVGVFVAMCIELAGEQAREKLGVPEGLVPLPPKPTADLFALRQNHRANAGLIDLVNAFSLQCLQPESDDLSEARYVEATEALLPAPTTPMTTGPGGLWIRPEGESRDTDRLEDATLIASYVADEVAHTPRPFRDFAVLAQSNEMLDAAAFAFARAGIPHVVAGRGFFASREVQDLVAMLRCIDRPDDRVALLAVLRGAWGALSDRTLIGLTETHRGLSTDLDRWDDLERRALVDESDRLALERVRVTLRALRSSAHKLGPGRALREAVRELELEQTLLLLPRGVQRIANVRKFLRMADRHATAASLFERVQRAEDRPRETEAATFSEDDDAVRLLTVHASKGLAFPVVLLPELHAAPTRATVTTFGVDLRSHPPTIAMKVLDERGEPVDAPSLQNLVDRERARMRAERRRLMYVAVTRAAERLVFVGGVKDRPTSSASAHATLGALLGSLAHHTDLLELRAVAVRHPTAIAGQRRDARSFALAPVRAFSSRSLSIAPTALQDFHHCRRRFWLVHITRLPEPERSVPTGGGSSAMGDARAEGEALHRVLERVAASAFGAEDAEADARNALASLDTTIDAAARDRVLRAASRFLCSSYARRLRSAGAIVRREVPFVLTLEAADQVVTLRGAMDLVVSWPDGEAHVVDYKRARGPDVKPHTLQLDVYALAARDQLGGGAHVRAGVVFLGGEGEPEPRFLPPVSRERVTTRVLELARGLAEARNDDHFPRAAPKMCHAIGCRYFSLCHPTPPKRQLTLFG